MREMTRPAGAEITAVDTAPQKIKKGPNRRTFLGQVGGAGVAAVISATATVAGPLAAPAGAQQNGQGESELTGRSRARGSFNNRVRAAEAEFDVRVPEQVTNGDEQRYSNRIGSYSKGLVHNSIGEVDNASYASLPESCEHRGSAPLRADSAWRHCGADRSSGGVGV